MLVTVSETMNVREGLTLWAKPSYHYAFPIGV